MGESKYISLTDSAALLIESNPKEALPLLKKALTIAESEDNEKFMAETLFSIGTAHHNLSNMAEALKCFKLALNIGYTEKDPFLKANLYRCIGVQLIRLNKLEEAINYLHESEKISQSCGFAENLQMIESTFGSLYIQLRMFDKALEHEQRSLEIANMLDIPGTKGHSCLGIGSCYYLLGDLENASLYLKMVFDDDSTMFTQTNTYYYLSRIHLDRNEFANALECAIEGHRIAAENNIDDYKAICLGMIGKINNKLGNHHTAVKYINDAIAISEKFENKKIYFSFYKDLIEAYGKLSDYRSQSLAYKNLYEYHTEYLESQTQLKIRQLNSEHQLENARNEAEIQTLKNGELRIAMGDLEKALDEVNKLNTELEELNDEKNDFMSLAAHDLKNPLQNILSTARIIKATNDNKDLKDFADNIVLQTDRMFTLIRKMLDHSAIEQGNIKIRKTEFKADRLCRELLNDFSGAAFKKNQNINFENLCNGDKVCTDYDILYQIMGNIVSNAVKFSGENRNIYLKSYPVNGSVVFEVQDEGPGFTEADKKKVFRKFSRLSAKPTSGENSTGLGLSIAKKLSQMIDADIHLESNEGKGSKFLVKIGRVKV